MRVSTILQSAALLSSIAVGSSYALNVTGEAPGEPGLALATPSPTPTMEPAVVIGCAEDESCNANSFDCNEEECSATSTCNSEAGVFVDDSFGDVTTCEEQTSGCEAEQCWTCEGDYAGCIAGAELRRNGRVNGLRTTSVGALQLQGPIRYESRQFSVRFTNETNTATTISVIVADLAVVRATIARNQNDLLPLPEQLQLLNGEHFLEVPANGSIMVLANMIVAVDTATLQEEVIFPLYARRASLGLPSPISGSVRAGTVRFIWPPR